jgi:hypothetical protein
MKHTFVLLNEPIRHRVIEILRAIPLDPVHEVIIREKKETRSTVQSSRMWAMLADVSRQVCWHGQYLSKEEWKEMVTAALKRQKVVPGIEGGFVVIGASTSKMSIAEMTEVIDFIFAFGDEHKVRWTDPTLPKDDIYRETTG